VAENFRFNRRKIKKQLPDNFTSKWSTRVLDEEFVPFPKRLLMVISQVFEGEHAITDLAVVLAVADYLRPDLNRGPSVEFLAFTAGLPSETFLERLQALEERGLLHREGPDEAMTIHLSGLLQRIEELTPDEASDGNAGGED
jgi:hypothetical protein